MQWQMALLLLLSSGFGALGQTLFKYATLGRNTLLEILNVWLLIGFVSYGFGAVLWIYCMSRVPLVKVYPFTAFALVLTVFSGIFLFGESVSLVYWLGLGFILLGLFLVSF